MNELSKIRCRGYLRGLLIVLITACLPLYFVCGWAALFVFVGGIVLYIWADLNRKDGKIPVKQKEECSRCSYLKREVKSVSSPLGFSGSSRYLCTRYPIETEHELCDWCGEFKKKESEKK